MEDLNNKYNNYNHDTKSSDNPAEEEEDDFFTVLDRRRGITDEQLKQKELEETGMIDVNQEVTKALQTLSKDDQEVFERTGIIHFDRTEPIENQVIKAVTLQKKNEAHQKRVIKTILYLMIIGIAVSLVGIFAGSYITSSATKKEAVKNPLAIDENEEAVMINETTFPDAEFRDYIKKNADTNSDGKLSADERNSFLIITLIGDPQLTNVKGIELFPLLQAVNLSNTGLTELNVENNTMLDTINISSTQLKTVDLSKNVQLTKVNVAGTSITSLTLPSPSKVAEVTVTNTNLNCTKDDNSHYNACSVK